MHGIKDSRFFGEKGVREGFKKRLLRNRGESVMLLDARPHWPNRKLPGKGDEIFSGIRCPRRDIDERRDLRIGPCPADDGATPGVGDQYGRAIFQRTCPAVPGATISRSAYPI